MKNIRFHGLKSYYIVKSCSVPVYYYLSSFYHDTSKTFSLFCLFQHCFHYYSFLLENYKLNESFNQSASENYNGKNAQKSKTRDMTTAIWFRP